MHNLHPVVRQLDKSTPSQDQGDIRKRGPIFVFVQAVTCPHHTTTISLAPSTQSCSPWAGEQSRDPGKTTLNTPAGGTTGHPPSHSSQRHSRATLTLHPSPTATDASRTTLPQPRVSSIAPMLAQLSWPTLSTLGELV